MIIISIFITQKSISQNVGIGTTTPQTTLDVKGNFRTGGSSKNISYDSTTGRIIWSNSNLFVPGSQYLMQHSASAEGLYYNSGQLEYRNQLGNPAFFTNWTNGNGYFSGKLGIGTSNPVARLHVTDSSVLFSAAGDIGLPGLPPLQGPGRRMMWYPGKAAFRAGYVNGTQWDQNNIGAYSFAAGFGTTASQNYTTALGYFSNASGVASTALGNQTTAKAYGALSIGSLNDFTDNPDPLNINATDRIFQIGNGFGFFPGNAMTVLRNGNVGIGTTNPLSKLHVYGTESNPNGNAAAIQLSNVAAGSGLNNWFLRTGATGTNTPAGGFSIGDNNATRFVIDNSGKVGIGTLAPTGSVEIKSTDTYQLVLGNPNTNPIDYTRILMTTPGFFGGQGSWQISSIISFALNYDKFIIADNSFGNVLSLSGDGNATLAGTLTQNSDLRLKKNITPLQNPLQKILQLNGYNYYWKNEIADNSLQTGVLAQDVQKLFPELVKQDSKGILSVNYSGLIPVLIESVKEQQKQIDELKELVMKLMNNKAIPNKNN